MTAEAEEKDKKDAFAYSWYLPVSGGPTPRGEQPPEPSTEPEPQPGNEGIVDSAHTVEEPEQKQMAAKSRLREASGSRFIVSPSLVRIAGLSVWSIISGVGMIALLVTQTPFPLTPVLAIAGLWAGVSVLIWFLPGKLTK